MQFFSKNLRYLRKKKREKQADISAHVNKKQNTIGNWENGISEPSIRELMFLSRYFAVNLEAFMSSDLEQIDKTNGEDFYDQHKNKKLKNYPMIEGPGTLASEANEDKFQVVIRELRNINEKLDSIKDSVKPKHNKKSSKEI